MTLDGLDGPAGSVGQVRESAARLAAFARASRSPVVLVGQVTKDGSLAGPKTLEHLVDAVLALEGDRYGTIRSCARRRTASARPRRSASSRCSAAGLRRSLDPAIALPLARRSRDQRPDAGSAIAATLEGSRPLLVEVQALVAPAGAGAPRRSPAVPTRIGSRCWSPCSAGVRASASVATISTLLAGGLSVAEPALDLPLAMAIASSKRDRPIDPATVACGEVGLLGELRPVAGLDRRLREAARLGFRRAIVPSAGNAPAIEGLVAWRSSGWRPSAMRSRWPSRYAAKPRGVPSWRRPGERRGTVVHARRCARLRGRMTRVVRVLGALLGILIAFQVAAAGGPTGGLFAGLAYGGFMLAAWVIAWGVLGFLILPYLTVVPAGALIRGVQRISTGEFVTAIAGLLLGLLMGLLLGLPLSSLPSPYGEWMPLAVSAVLGLGMLGLTVVKRNDLLEAVEALGVLPRGRDEAPPQPVGPTIIVDTSAIIDGRIADIADSGFLFGVLVVARFVLVELQHIADHSDTAKRNRGRRGLEILAALQKGDRIPVEISEQDFPEIGEVDQKLIALAMARGGAILTNDYNLNRVAELQGLRVLNVNHLANAVKPAFLPGEELHVRVIQEGKEAGQGVAFLDDGTMIVVEGGDRSWIVRSTSRSAACSRPSPAAWSSPTLERDDRRRGRPRRRRRRGRRLERSHGRHRQAAGDPARSAAPGLDARRLAGSDLDANAGAGHGARQGRAHADRAMGQSDRRARRGRRASTPGLGRGRSSGDGRRRRPRP